MRCVCSEPQTRRNRGGKRPAGVRAPPPPKNGWSLFSPGGAGGSSRGRSALRPLSRAQMTGWGPRAAGRALSPGVVYGFRARGPQWAARSFPPGRPAGRPLRMWTLELVNPAAFPGPADTAEVPARGLRTSPGSHRVPQTSKQGPTAVAQGEDALWACVRICDSAPSPWQPMFTEALGCLSPCPGRFRPGAAPGFGASLSPGLPHPLGASTPHGWPCPLPTTAGWLWLQGDGDVRAGGRTCCLLHPDPPIQTTAPSWLECISWGQAAGPGPRMVSSQLCGHGLITSPLWASAAICKTGVFTACLCPRALGKVI